MSDLVEVISRLMESNLATPCNVGNPHEMTMLQLAEYINRFTDSTAGIVHRPLPKDDPSRRRPDISLATSRLGWEPQVDFEDGVSRTVAYFRALLERGELTA